MALIMDLLVEVGVSSKEISYYRRLGYTVPVREVQLWSTNKQGVRVKNGTEFRVAKGTRIKVRKEHLCPHSNVPIRFVCSSCKQRRRTTHSSFLGKKTTLCKRCEGAKVKNTGCHSYWVEKLIVQNPEAACVISGEKDKRFLVLHHLLSRKAGGKHEASNYVILSANYHLAFHNWNGGYNVSCTPDKFWEFYVQEKSQTDILATDWVTSV